MTTTDVNPLGLVLAGLFLVGFVALVVWFYRKTWATGWFVKEANALGWSPEPATNLDPEFNSWGWRKWFAWAGEVRIAASARAHVGPVERALLIRIGPPGPGGRPGPYRGAWICAIGHLPRSVRGSVVLIPYMGSIGKWAIRTGMGRETVPLRDDVLDRSWMAYTDDPEAISASIRDDPQLRAALVSISAGAPALRERVPEAGTLPRNKQLRHASVVLELRRDRFALLMGANAFPAGIGRLEYLSGVVEGFTTILGT